MDLLAEMLKHTPWWVYVVFVYLTLIGLRSTRPRTVSVRQLLFLPLIFTILNFVWLSERLQGHFSLAVFWLFGLAVGARVGWLMVRKWIIHVHNRETISLPPTRSVLILVLLFFTIRYFFVFHYAMHPEAAAHLFVADAFISGVMTGIFSGRSYQFFIKYHRVV